MSQNVPSGLSYSLYTIAARDKATGESGTMVLTLFSKEYASFSTNKVDDKGR